MQGTKGGTGDRLRSPTHQCMPPMPVGAGAGQAQSPSHRPGLLISRLPFSGMKPAVLGCLFPAVLLL